MIPNQLGHKRKSVIHGNEMTCLRVQPNGAVIVVNDDFATVIEHVFGRVEMLN